MTYLNEEPDKELKNQLHIGLTPWQMKISAQTDGKSLSLAQQAQLGEQLGFESFWLPENHFRKELSIPDPMQVLAGAAALTSSIKLATTSYLLPLRHPLLAAEQVAVLDQLSHGRVILGIGRGFEKAMFSAFGIKRSEKRAILETNLGVLKAAWRGEDMTPEEDAGPAVLNPLPVQRPHPPIWIAAFGPKALAQAAKLQLPYLASPIESKAQLHDNFRAAEDNPEIAGPRTRPVMRTVFVSNNSQELANARAGLEKQIEAMRAIRPAALQADGVRIEDCAIIGEPAAVAEQIAEYQESLAITHLIATRLQLPGLDDAVMIKSYEMLAALRDKL